jgi:tripartite-type tricarboxylate transporter receptor subunit TctC
MRIINRLAAHARALLERVCFQRRSRPQVTPQRQMARLAAHGLAARTAQPERMSLQAEGTTMSKIVAVSPSPTRRALCEGLAATPLAAALGWSPLARAQANYPSRPVRFILPFGAGGVADVTSRLVMEKLGEKLGQRFVVENMPGAGGISAVRAAQSAAADGYTLLLMTNGNAISAALFKSLPYDPTKDFVPVSSIGTFDCLFIVNASSPYRTLADFMKAAKEQPGKLNIATITAGSTQHLTAELFKASAGLDVVIVPSRTSGEAVVALLRNDVQMVIDFYAALKPPLSDAKARALAWSGPQSSPALPDVPAAIQTVPGFEVVSWNSMYAPAGTPQAVIDTLNRALREVLADPELKKKALDMGIDLAGGTPAEVDARLRTDIQKWNRLIDRVGIERK